MWSNHFKTGGYPCILAAQATAQSPPYPIWTDPTNPARRPSDRPIAAIDTPRAPTLGPLGTRPDKTQGMGPPGPPAFSCFRFFPPSLSLGSAGPPTTREFKNAPPILLSSGPPLTCHVPDLFSRASEFLHSYCVRWGLGGSHGVAPA